MQLSDDEANIANDLFDKAKSNLDTPIIGSILTPVCKSCKNSDYHYGTWNEPECKIYGSIPDKYRLAVTKNCPHYLNEPNSKFVPFTEEDKT